MLLYLSLAILKMHVTYDFGDMTRTYIEIMSCENYVYRIIKSVKFRMTNDRLYNILINLVAI